MRSYFDGLLRYFELSGRSTRAQYWLYFLLSLLVGAAAVFADSWLAGVPFTSAELGPLTAFAALFHAIPSVTVTVRRLHDTGRSGWWYLLYFVPLGFIFILVWTCLPSDDYANDYGDHPRDAAGQPMRRARQTHSTIPRLVRMGSNGTRPQTIGQDLGPAPERFI
ncbi:MAG TPA: DUF805 domain-containing protein [Devosia sp.]|jgi:uncharacterized membrane protein YhaH (DUF805 family)|nr:DUF805 domain-containing protein [Devosia sp.]